MLDLPSRPTSVRFNNARSTSLCASIYASVPNSFTFHVYVHAKHTVFEGIYSKSFSFLCLFQFFSSNPDNFLFYTYHRADFFESTRIYRSERRKGERRSMLESMDSPPHVPIIFSWVSLIVVGEGGSKRRKNTTKRCFQFFTTKRARGERMNGRVRVVRRIHDEAITTFFAGEVMCY